MPNLIKAGETAGHRKRVKFYLYAADGVTPVTGASVAVRSTINGGTPAAGGGTVTQKDATNEPGVYYYVPSATEIASGVEVLDLYFSAPGALSWPVEVLVTAGDPLSSPPTLEEVTGGSADAVVSRFGFTGSVSDATPAAGEFDAAAGLSAVDGFYNGGVLSFTSGPLDGLARKITGYTGATRTFTFSTAFPAAPADGDTFIILGRID